jgi:hypothetical protein
LSILDARSLSPVLGGPCGVEAHRPTAILLRFPDPRDSALAENMSVSEPDVVDVISTDRESGKVVLTVSDHLGWGDEADEHVAALQAKLEHYVDFIKSGQIYDAYPKAAARQSVIEVVHMIPPDARGEAWLESARAQLAAAGLVLSWSVLREDDAP